MLLRHFYDEKLAQASYLVGCPVTGEAIVIDPARHVQPYLDAAEAHGLTITAVTETHIHADFASGARELGARTGAMLLLSGEGGEGWQYTGLDDYAVTLLYDGDTFSVGDVQFTVIHTPGHTPEHLIFKVTDRGDYGFFTGDFLFVGDVGRPDLLEKAAGLRDTAEVLAHQMFAAVQRIKGEADYLQVFPGHGAGSACGKALGAVPSSTIGYEKRFNPMLQIDDEAEFVRVLLADQPEVPTYFAVMKQVNRDGLPHVKDADVADKLPPLVLRQAIETAATIIDTRARDVFQASHLPGTFNIPLDRNFPTWAGWLIDYTKPFYAITDQPDALKRDLYSIGLDNFAGYFSLPTLEAVTRSAGITPIDYAKLSPQAAYARYQRGELTVVDVRNDNEWATGHIPNALHIMLGRLPQESAQLPNDQPLLIHCAAGLRSAIAASWLQAHGYNVVTLDGGLDAWVKAGYPTTP